MFYMGCKSYRENLIENLFAENEFVYSQVKEDGQFINLFFQNGEIKTFSRNGLPHLFLDAKFIKSIKTAGLKDNFVLNGELLIDGEPNRAKANGTIKRISKHCEKVSMTEDAKEIEKLNKKFIKACGEPFETLKDKLILKVWDVIPFEEFENGECSKPYSARFEDLHNLVNIINSNRIEVVETEIIKDKVQAMRHFKECLSRRLEGTVLKSPNGIFKDGKHNWQVKMKMEFNLDLKIVGFNEGTIGTKNEGSISSVRCETEDGILKANVIGFPEYIREMLNDNREEFIGTIIEIKCNGLSENQNGGKSVLSPSFVELREDKETANTYEECIEIENSVLEIEIECEESEVQQNTYSEVATDMGYESAHEAFSMSNYIGLIRSKAG